MVTGVSDVHQPLSNQQVIKTARCWFCHLVDIIPDERQSVAFPSGYVLYRACRCERYCHFRCLLRHKRIRKCPTCNDDLLGNGFAVHGRVHFEVCRICNLAEFMDGQGGTVDDKKLVRPCRCVSMTHHGCIAAIIDKQKSCKVCGERIAYSTYGSFFHFTKRYPCFVTIPIILYTIIFGFATVFIRNLCMNGIGNMRQSLTLAGATGSLVASSVIFFYWIVYTASVRIPIFKKHYGHVSVYDFKLRGCTSSSNASKSTSQLASTELSRGFSADSFKATSTPRRSPMNLTAQLADLDYPVTEDAIRRSSKYILENGDGTPHDSDLDSIDLERAPGNRGIRKNILFNHRLGSIQSYHSSELVGSRSSMSTDSPPNNVTIITQHSFRPDRIAYDDDDH